MLSNGFARPLHLKRRPSQLLAWFLAALHVLALVALLQPLALSWLMHAMFFSGVLLSLACHFVYFRHQSDDRCYWTWQADGVWLYGDGDHLSTLVSSKSVQTPWFVTLTLAGHQQQLRLLIVRDQLDADTFRRLRVRVKLHHEETAARSEEPV